jgi:hyperosmotically inducible periplasmic protein
MPLRVFVVLLSLLAVSPVTASVAPDLAPDVNDVRILDQATATVNGCPHFTIFDDVSVSVENGIVTLVGKMTMGYKRDELQKRVGAIAGVKQVVNQLEVLPASSFDDTLRQRIARAIYGNANFWTYAAMRNPPIHIIVEGSRVTLTGLVRTETDRRLAQALATQFNALSVSNALKTDAEMRGRRDPSQ